MNLELPPALYDRLEFTGHQFKIQDLTLPLIANGLPTLPDRTETVSLPFGRRYTRMTDAVWIISLGVVAEDLDEGMLSALPFETADTTGPVGLTTRADTPPALPTLMLMQAIRDASRGLAGG